jgi:hypothetical protein
MGDKPRKKVTVKKVAKKSLAQTHPKLAKEADGWDANRVTPSSAKKLPWKCKNGHTWNAIVANRSKGNGCPICAGQMVLAGTNDLLTLYPEIAKQAFGWDTSKFRPGSNQKQEWICSKGHKWLATPNERTGRDKTNCPYCSNVRVLKGFNDVKTEFPSIAREAHGWDAEAVLPGSHKKVEWKCSLGHTYKATVKHRCYSGTNCPYCTNTKVLKGFNDLATINPTIAAQADGWDATKFGIGHARMPWKCSEGHSWRAEITSRVKLGTGCPSCAEYGFQPAEPAYLYLLTNHVWGMLKIGITNSKMRRNKEHARNAWVPVEVKRFSVGEKAYEWEQRILKYLHSHGADLGRSDIAGKFDGYTESWVADSFPVKSIKHLMKLVAEDEE